MKFLRCLLALALALLPLSEARAASGYTVITVKDAAGVTQNITVLSSTGIVTGNLNWANVICDQSAGTTCASVGTAGSPSTNALTTQAVTLGHGTAANAMRVELPTDGTGLVSAAQSGTWTVAVSNALTAIANNADAVASSAGCCSPVANYNYGYNGTTWDRLQVDGSKNLKAGITAWGGTALGTPTNFGTTPGAVVALSANASLFQGTTAAINGGTAGSFAMGGSVATNVAITDNPLNMGAQAVSSENTAVTTARKVQLVADLVGKLITLPYANPENFVSGATAAMTGTTSTSLIAAPASGLRNYLTHIICTNSHATVGTFVTVQDGSGGTTIYEGYAASVGGGFSITFPAPLRQPTTATALFVADVTTGANVICSGSGYKGV